MAEIKVSIATPTYNRAYCINGVFESLIAQTLINFEWIIIDDGSTDETHKIVEEFKKKSKFDIIYIKQENRGKHSSINKAIQIAKGELFLIFDSDDKCHVDSIEFMTNKWDELSRKYNNLAGITTLSCNPNGDIIGNQFPIDGDIKHLTKYYEINNIHGDKWDIHSTLILKSHPFPEEIGQKFCPEGLIWNRISKNYVTAFFNKPTKIAEYLDDGLSKNRISLLIKYPKFYCLYYKELYSLTIFYRNKLKAASNYIRASMHARNMCYANKSDIIMIITGIPLGFAAYIIDKTKYHFSKIKY